MIYFAGREIFMILNRELSYSCGSTARRGLMGFAIICIILCHSEISLSGVTGQNISDLLHKFYFSLAN